jgi:hypothetical protein
MICYYRISYVLCIVLAKLEERGIWVCEEYPNLENKDDFENASNILSLVLGFTKSNLTLFTKTTVSTVDSRTFENPPPTYP